MSVTDLLLPSGTSGISALPKAKARNHIKVLFLASPTPPKKEEMVVITTLLALLHTSR